MTISTSEEIAHPRPHVRIIPFVAFTFVAYLSIGVTLAVLPTFAHDKLGVGPFVAGVLISLQYIATFLSRPRAGLMTDTIGPKKTVRLGLIACTIAGLFILSGALLAKYRGISLTLFVLSRLAMGTGESLCGTGAIMWAIGRVGAMHTAQIISLNGIATYGALALGAPLGVLIEKYSHFSVIGILILIVGMVAFWTANLYPETTTVSGERFSAKYTLAKVTPFGIALALGGLGFGSIATFITLYFHHRQWEGAALALSIFGIVFVAARILLSGTILRFGGFRVTQVSLLIEALGLVILALSPSPTLTYVASGLIGLGFALIFPALAVEMVKKFPPSMRGSAIGIYTAFTDLALFLTGPMAGLVIEHYGYRNDFLAAALGVFASFILVFYLARLPSGNANPIPPTKSK